MTTIVLALLCAQAVPATPQANQADAVLTVKKKVSTWSFATIPEHRVKEGDQELDVPTRIVMAWRSPVRKPDGNPFATSQDMWTVDFYQPGKRYGD